MNKINDLESNNNKNQTSNNEKTFDIFKKILNKIKNIESLVNIEIDNKLNNTIDNIDKNRKFLEINDISNVIYEELEKIEYNIRHNKDKKDVNITKNKVIPEYRNEINLIYYTEREGIQNIFGEKFVENNKNNIELNIN